MKFISLVALASMAMAAPAKEKRAPSPLDVTLEMVGNSAVKATIINHGKKDFKIFKTGTLLDTNAIEKAQVFQNGESVAFDGIRLTISTSNLEEDAFEFIASGQSIEVTFDVAEVHDMAAGGVFDISVWGALQYAEGLSTELVGSVPFESNIVAAEVDGGMAAASRKAFDKRTILQSDCTGTRLTAVTNALSVCRSLATAAQSAAQTDSARLVEFFKTSSVSSTVATVFSRVATQCGSSTSGSSRLYCSDVYPACSSGVIAYTLPSSSYMAYCPLFFSMPLRGSGCYTQAQGNTIVHEATHLTQVRGTSDYGGYGYNFVRSLSASQNLNHADTYTLFAQSLYAGC